MSCVGMYVDESMDGWMDRHKHILTAFEEIPAKLKEFARNNKIAAMIKKAGANMTAAEISRATKDAPAYQEAMKVFSKHINVCQVLRTAINKKQVRELGTIEQVTSSRSLRQNANDRLILSDRVRAS